MNKKKIVWLIPLLALSLTACSQKQKQAAPKPLTKAQVIKIASKSFKSGQVIQSVKLASDETNQVVTANTVFGGQQATFHINNQITSKGKSSRSEEWISSNHVYINGSSSWYKANLERLSGHTYADLVSAVYNNPVLTNPAPKLLNSYKLSHKKSTYTLKATISDKQIADQVVAPIAQTLAQAQNQAQVLKRIRKYSTKQKLQVELVVKDKKLAYANMFVTAKLGKKMNIRWGQSYGNFGSHDFLKVPTNVLAAKDLPTSKK